MNQPTTTTETPTARAARLSEEAKLAREAVRAEEDRAAVDAHRSQEAARQAGIAAAKARYAAGLAELQAKYEPLADAERRVKRRARIEHVTSLLTYLQPPPPAPRTDSNILVELLWRLKAEEERDEKEWAEEFRVSLQMTAHAAVAAPTMTLAPRTTQTSDDDLLILKGHLIQLSGYTFPAGGTYVTPSVMGDELCAELRKRVAQIEAGASATPAARGHMMDYGAWLIPAAARGSVQDAAKHCPLPVAEIIEYADARTLRAWYVRERSAHGAESMLAQSLYKALKAHKAPPLGPRPTSLEVASASWKGSPVDRPDLVAWALANDDAKEAAQ